MPSYQPVVETAVAEVCDAGCLEKTGKLLREAIDSEYSKLSELDRLRSMGLGGNDITYIASMLIKPGMKLNDAENILRSAGFCLRPKGSSILKGDTKIIADINPYRLLFLGKVSIIAFLYPVDADDDESNVSRVSVGIVLETL